MPPQLKTSSGKFRVCCFVNFRLDFKNKQTKISEGQTDEKHFSLMNRDFFFLKEKRKKDGRHICICWGSNCFQFHHVLVLTLTQFLMGVGRNGCAVQLIFCSKSRGCPSFTSLFYEITLCPSVSSSAT